MHDKKSKHGKTDHSILMPEPENSPEVQRLIDALTRERADATNLRRRYEEQMAGLRNIMKVGIVRNLLPIIDNFERSLKHVPPELADNDYVKGVQGIVKQFEKTLADMGVTRIKTVGEPFDPRLHDAVSMEEGEGTQEIITDELLAGYAMGEEVVRHAMVRVARR